MDIANRARVADSTARPPRQLVAGLALLAVAWPLAWVGSAPYASYTFFPLWLGYILTVDGLTARRTGTSLLTRSGQRFALLFGFSLPSWWFFEFANQFLGNWRYQLPREYSPIVYFLLASVAFSTVMPAIFVTAEFYRGFRPFAPARRSIRFAPTRTGLAMIAVLGLVMFVASLVFPDVAFPLVWVGLFLTVDAINALTGSRSLAAQVAEGCWDTVLVLFAAGLTCGFFWEMWNYWSMPKWIYDIPYASWLPIFEMPVLGYGGYFPFALEVYAFYHLLHGLVVRRPDDYLRFDEPAAG